MLNRTPDVTIRAEGNLWTFTLHTSLARQWVVDHVATIPSYLILRTDEKDGLTSAFAADWRQARDIGAGMSQDLAIEESIQ